MNPTPLPVDGTPHWCIFKLENLKFPSSMVNTMLTYQKEKQPSVYHRQLPSSCSTGSLEMACLWLRSRLEFSKVMGSLKLSIQSHCRLLLWQLWILLLLKSPQPWTKNTTQVLHIILLTGRLKQVRLFLTCWTFIFHKVWLPKGKLFPCYRAAARLPTTNPCSPPRHHPVCCSSAPPTHMPPSALSVLWKKRPARALALLRGHSQVLWVMVFISLY